MPTKSESSVSIEQIDGMIRTIRGVRVMLDRDLAKIYGVPTFRFNEAIKRNRDRFPPDFMFQLTREEFDSLKSQSAMSKLKDSSQTAMSSAKHRGTAYRPYAFTEHGALQAANVLRSSRAVQMSVFVIRAFVKMRETLLGTRDLAKKLAVLEKKLTSRLDAHEAAIVQVLQEIMQILNPPPLPPEPRRRRIGFHEP
jgi:ORF6N domain.